VGTVSSGSSVTLVITARVDVSSSVLNTVQITHSDQDDPIPGNNTSTVSITPQIANLTLTKSVDNPTPYPGATLVYTLTLSNAGPDSASHVAVTDKLPAGLTFVSATPSQGNYDSVTGVWSVGDLAATKSVTLVLRTATAVTDTSTAITNVTTITSTDQFDPDGPTGVADGPPPSTTSTFVPFEPMSTGCFGAYFNFARHGGDKLVFLGNPALPADFRPAGKLVSLSLCGFTYSCVLNTRGQSRSGGIFVEIRKVGGAWRLAVRMSRQDLQSQIPQAVNETVKTVLTGLVLAVEVDGRVYGTRLDPLYSATKGRSGKLLHK
jgi:uncharacterized repeat protein (TIGR01451 family)